MGARILALPASGCPEDQAKVLWKLQTTMRVTVGHGLPLHDWNLITDRVRIFWEGPTNLWDESEAPPNVHV